MLRVLYEFFRLLTSSSAPFSFVVRCLTSKHSIPRKVCECQTITLQRYESPTIHYDKIRKVGDIMTSGLRRLQAKYLNGVDTLSRSEVERFISLLEGDAGAPFREERLPRLKTRLTAIERQERVEQAEKDEHKALLASRDAFRAITGRWEAEGAIRQDLHGGMTEAWSLDGTELYRWGVGYRPTMHEMLADVQRIDKEVFGREGD